MGDELKTYRLIWHSIRDVEFDVDAFDEDDAKHTLCLFLHGELDDEDEGWVREV